MREIDPARGGGAGGCCGSVPVSAAVWAACCSRAVRRRPRSGAQVGAMGEADRSVLPAISAAANQILLQRALRGQKIAPNAQPGSVECRPKCRSMSGGGAVRRIRPGSGGNSTGKRLLGAARSAWPRIFDAQTWADEPSIWDTLVRAASPEDYDG
jgi:hypothetical protein